MPEGPEVHRICDSIQPLLINKILISLEFNEYCKYASKKVLKNYEAFKKLLPLKIVNVQAVGKKIVIFLEKDISIVSSLGMTGHWVIKKENHSNLWLDVCNTDKQDEKMRLYYDDQRRFGNLEIYLDQESLEKKLKSFGPDILATEVSKDEWLTIFRKRYFANKEICVAILDEKGISGIGNYLRAEIIYRARIYPWTKVSDLSDKQLEILRIKSHKVIRESYASGGVTIESFWDCYGEPGKFRSKLRVYNRKKDDYGNPVCKDYDRKKRMMHWVPNIYEETDKPKNNDKERVIVRKKKTE